MVIILLGLFTIPTTGFIVLQNRTIQTYIAGKIASTVSENLDAEFTIESVDMILFNRVVMKNVLLKDQYLDTLLHAPSMVATLKILNSSSKNIELSRLSFENATVRLATDTARLINLKFIVDELRTPPDSNRTKWKVRINSIDFEKSRFIYENYFKPGRKQHGINFTNILLSDMDLEVRDLRVANDTIFFRVQHLDGVEKSGFDLSSFTGLAALNKEFMDLRDIHIITNHSDIRASRLDFRFAKWQDFGRGGFVHKVKLGFDFDPSTLLMEDLGYFAQGLKGIDRTIYISGNIRGKINSLKAKNIVLRYNDHTHFSGNFDMEGLPNFQETYMFFDIDSLTTAVADIESIQIPNQPGETVDLSESLDKLGNIMYQGKYVGYYNDFVTYGNFRTDLGLISSDLSIRPDSAENVHFRGELSTQGFDMGKLIDLEKRAGIISMNGNVEGVSYRGGGVSASMDGLISLLEFNDYGYQNIILAGDLTNNKFDGSFSIEDPNLKMEFFGKIDYGDTIPVFDFTANVDKARLHPLNISSSDPTYTLSCYLRANFTGANLDDFDGEIHLVNSLFQKQDKQIQIYDINLYAQHRPDTNRMTLRSDLVDAEVIGQYEFEDIGEASTRLLAHHLPAFRNLTKHSTEKDSSSNDFRFRFHFKNTFPLTDFFYPDLELDPNSMLAGNYNPARHELNLSAQFPGLRFRENTMEDMEVHLVSNDSVAELLTSSTNLETGELLSLENINLLGKAERDTFQYNLHWENAPEADQYVGKIEGQAAFFHRTNRDLPRINLSFDPGYIVLSDTIWTFDQALITIDTSFIRINQFRLAHEDQSLGIDGTISRQPSDQLHIQFDNLNFSQLNIASMKFGLELDGVINGSSTISDVYDKLTFLSDLSIEQFSINREELGNTLIKANWINPEKKIELDAEAMRGNLKTLDIKGDYYPDSRRIDFDISLDKLRLNIFEPYLDVAISELSGITSGELRLIGTTYKPVFNGKISVQKTSLKVDYLQTLYSFSDAVEIRDNHILFSDFEIFDESGSRAVLNGSIKNTYLQDFIFDLNLNAENFRFLATRERHNEHYYGDVVATGLMRFSGSPGDLQLFISARTDRGTHVFIPVSQGRSIQENNFITFINTGVENDMPDEPEPSPQSNLSGFSFEMNLEITPSATTEIIFDPQVGDVMKGNGSGNIQLLVSPQSPLRMYGDYLFESGEYLFTLQNIINKRLKVQRGGNISWNGDPTTAIIDMHAIYNAKAAPAVLVPEPPEHLKKRMPVECHLIMSGNLTGPLINFDIQMPTAEEETQNILRNAISSEEELTKQFLSLLVINNFSSVNVASGSGTASGTRAGMAGVTASELLSNQLSNWLSQISNDFDIGVNYRPGDEISSDQVEVALSTQIFDDRVTLHTNLDYSSQASSSTANPRTNNFAGDFNVDVKITENGKFRLKAYNRYNHDQLYKTSPYTQGVGFMYREDFNNFSELGRRYRDAITRSNRKDPEESPEEDTIEDPDGGSPEKK